MLLEIVKVTHEHGMAAIIFGEQGRTEDDSLTLVGDIHNPTMTTSRMSPQRLSVALKGEAWCTLQEFCVRHDIPSEEAALNSFTTVADVITLVKALFCMRDGIEQVDLMAEVAA